MGAVDRFNGWLGDLLSVNAPLRIAPTRQAVRPWLEGVLSSHRPLARMRGVELVAEFDGAPDEATFDPRHLEHALVALVTNAIQASPDGGSVTLGCRGSAGFWEVEVRDQGEGIGPETLPKIFRPYFTTKRDGTGIGLAVAQQVVQGHGGEINVRSSAGLGTCFTVRVPIGLGCSDQPADSSRLAVLSHTEVARGTDPGR
jgi:signal transduction histidine kinase